eukprot:8197138-Heterocapsa_arctica.AAC.1
MQSEGHGEADDGSGFRHQAEHRSGNICGDEARPPEQGLDGTAKARQAQQLDVIDGGRGEKGVVSNGGNAN